jgi:hypothetical protein
VAPSNFPLVLYAVNGVLPITICLKNQMWWAAGLGFLAMALPLALAIRAGAPRQVRASRHSAAPRLAYDTPGD